MPSNTKYFTVVRNPYNQMLSSFNYFHHLDFFKKYKLGAEGLSDFLNDTQGFYKSRDKRKDSIFIKPDFYRSKMCRIKNKQVSCQE